MYPHRPELENSRTCAILSSMGKVESTYPYTGRDLQEGSEQAWNELFESKYSLFQATLRRKRVPEEELADVIQQAFLQAYRSISTLRAGDDPIPWLVRVVQNAGIDYWRSRGRQIQPVELETLENIRGGDNPEEEYLRKEKVEQQLKPFSPEIRLIFNRRVEGYGYSEIGREMNTSGGALRHKFYRAVRETQGHPAK